jgi:hypothetical protein
MRKTFPSKIKVLPLIFLNLFIWYGTAVNAQLNNDTILNQWKPAHFVEAVDRKIKGLEDKLMDKSIKTLNKLQKQ